MSSLISEMLCLSVPAERPAVPGGGRRRGGKVQTRLLGDHFPTDAYPKHLSTQRPPPSEPSLTLNATVTLFRIYSFRIDDIHIECRLNSSITAVFCTTAIYM